MAKITPDIISALTDKRLFRPFLKDLSSWQAWIVALKALFGLELNSTELNTFQHCTGREKHSKSGYKELWAVCGRRAGKSTISAIIAVYIALFFNFKKYLSPGERGIVQITAADRSQAQVILRYIKSILRSTPMFEQYIASELRESVELSNDIIIEVMSCSYRSIRGRTIVCSINDEISFWRSEGVNVDREVLSSIRPAMATIPISKMVSISSPYARSGELWQAHKEYFGKESAEVLVWKAPTTVMNPNISQALIDREYARDPVAAASEWLGEFRSDIESFISAEVLESAVQLGVYELPYHTNHVYQGFCDPAGGSGSDSFTLAIAHEQEGTRVLDCTRERKPPFSPVAITAEFADVLKSYHLSEVCGDRFSGGWVREAFEKCGISYRVSDKIKSELYLEVLPLLNSRKVQLLDNERLIKQFIGLERRTSRAGRDSVDHGPGRGSHDDLCNSVAGAVVAARDYGNVEVELLGETAASLADW